MVILRSQNKITDFLMILAWDCPFNLYLHKGGLKLHLFHFNLPTPYDPTLN